jgi:hypothetical protein
VQALGAAYGFDSYFFWQPVSFSKRNPTNFEAEQVAMNSYVKDFMLTVYGDMRGSAVLKETKSFHDLSSIFDDSDEQVYLDWAHLTEDANDLIAERITTTLIAAQASTTDAIKNTNAE